jgi:hypothetical protein
MLRVLDSSVGLQRRRNPGPVQCYNSGHNLPSAALHGTSLLDSRILGSCVAGDALHHIRVPLEALERAELRWRTEHPLSRGKRHNRPCGYWNELFRLMS